MRSQFQLEALREDITWCGFGTPEKFEWHHLGPVTTRNKGAHIYCVRYWVLLTVLTRLWAMSTNSRLRYEKLSGSESKTTALAATSIICFLHSRWSKMGPESEPFYFSCALRWRSNAELHIFGWYLFVPSSNAQSLVITCLKTANPTDWVVFNKQKM